MATTLLDTREAVIANVGVSPVLAVTTTSLPDGVVGEAYSARLSASGGTPPYTWSGKLPPGLSLSPGGAITGRPGAEAAGPIAFKVTDSKGDTATKTLSITIKQAANWVPYAIGGGAVLAVILIAATRKGGAK